MNAKLTLALAALLAATVSTAMAADLPMPNAVPVAAPPAPTWDGPYVGIDIGGGAGTENDNLSTVLPEPLSADAFSLSGFSAGVYAGDNWTVDQFVLGVEGDLNYANLSGTHDFYQDSLTNGTLGLSSNWQAFAKVRAGLPIDQFLLYATAGVGAANATLTLTPGSDPTILEAASASNVHIGGTVGIGAEYQLTDNLVGRAEVDYAQFANTNYDLGLDGPVSAGWSQTTGSVGLSIKF